MDYFLNDLYFNILLKIKLEYPEVYTNNQKLIRRISFTELEEFDILSIRWVPELTSYDDHSPDNINKYINLTAEIFDSNRKEYIQIYLSGSNNLIELIRFPKNCIRNLDITTFEIVEDKCFLRNKKEVKTLSRMFKNPKNTIKKHLDIANSFSYWKEKYYYSIKRISPNKHVMIDKKGNIFIHTHKRPEVLRTKSYYQYVGQAEIIILNKNIYTISIEEFLEITT